MLPWDDVLLATQSRPVPQPLRLIVAPNLPTARLQQVQFNPDDQGLVDDGLRQAEGIWVGKFIAKRIDRKLGCQDWGKVQADGKHRTFSVTVEAYAVVEKLPIILEAIREATAQLRHEYVGHVMIHLISPVPEPTPAQKELEAQFQEQQEKADQEERERDARELLERQHRLELKKNLGEKIKPEEFTAPPPIPPPVPPWEREEEDADNHGIGGIGIREKMEPPPDPWDNDHPLADKYRLMAYLTPAELWVMPHQRDLAIYLLGKEPDEDIQPDQPPSK